MNTKDFFYVYDINFVSYLLMNGISHTKVDRNPVTGKLKFYFVGGDYINQFYNEYKNSDYKKFTQFQNEIRKVVHSN